MTMLVTRKLLQRARAPAQHKQSLAIPLPLREAAAGSRLGSAGRGRASEESACEWQQVRLLLGFRHHWRGGKHQCHGNWGTRFAV